MTENEDIEVLVEDVVLDIPATITADTIQLSETLEPDLPKIGPYTIVDGHPRKPVLFVKDANGKEFVLKSSSKIFIPRVEGLTPSGLGQKVFDYECDIHSSLQHPNVCPAQVVVLDGDKYLLMPRIGNQNLLDAVERLSRAQIVSVLEQIASALDYCHKREIVHLDVKMENAGYNGTAALLDFGSARRLNEKDEIMKRKELLSCTERTAAREYVESGVFNPRTDTFSFAYIAYTALTGREPFKHLRDRIVYDNPAYDPKRLEEFGLAGALIIRGLGRNKDRPGMDELAGALKEQSAKYNPQPSEQPSEPSPVLV